MTTSHCAPLRNIRQLNTKQGSTTSRSASSPPLPAGIFSPQTTPKRTMHHRWSKLQLKKALRIHLQLDPIKKNEKLVWLDDEFGSSFEAQMKVIQNKSQQVIELIRLHRENDTFQQAHPQQPKETLAEYMSRLLAIILDNIAEDHTIYSFVNLNQNYYGNAGKKT